MGVGSNTTNVPVLTSQTKSVILVSRCPGDPDLQERYIKNELSFTIPHWLPTPLPRYELKGGNSHMCECHGPSLNYKSVMTFPFTDHPTLVNPNPTHLPTPPYRRFGNDLYTVDR